MENKKKKRKVLAEIKTVEFLRIVCTVCLRKTLFIYLLRKTYHQKRSKILKLWPLLQELFQIAPHKKKRKAKP